ncbi:hypothetical protein [Catellatospora sp. NPDC049609]|uniref:hypothetical protein n=1 Tax=Catellatospora sp. NPDC049609 TaxID=3155505 RepID=UPI00341CDEA2
MADAAPAHGQDNATYVEVSDDAFAVHVAGTFDADRAREGSLILRGTCPRCRHAMEYVITSGVIRSWQQQPSAEPTPTAASPAPSTAPSVDTGAPVEQMCCTCDQEHIGRPADYLGCGAYWNLAISVA